MTALEKINRNGIKIELNDLMVIVNKYQIKEISVFGSSIRDDFSEKSDLDFLITFVKSEDISLFDLMDIQEYLENLTKRNVDLVEPDGLKNPYRRKHILESKETIYAA